MRSLTSKPTDLRGNRKATLRRRRHHICTRHEVVSYLFGTAHLFKTSRSKSAILKKCNQKCLVCRDREAAFIFTSTNTGFLPPRRRQGGRHSANATRRPCFVEITIIVTHVWKYYVCEELLPVSPVISWLAKNRAKCWSEPADKHKEKCDWDFWNNEEIFQNDFRASFLHTPTLNAHWRASHTSVWKNIFPAKQHTLIHISYT